jgi:RHS repeat-associated protein
LRFSGQYYDSETGLHYNYNRYYDPRSGRYITPDPIGNKRGGNHLYVYVRNNPIIFFDNIGLFQSTSCREIGRTRIPSLQSANPDPLYKYEDRIWELEDKIVESSDDCYCRWKSNKKKVTSIYNNYNIIYEVRYECEEPCGKKSYPIKYEEEEPFNPFYEMTKTVPAPMIRRVVNGFTHNFLQCSCELFPGGPGKPPWPF